MKKLKKKPKKNFTHLYYDHVPFAFFDGLTFVFGLLFADLFFALFSFGFKAFTFAHFLFDSSHLAQCGRHFACKQSAQMALDDNTSASFTQKIDSRLPSFVSVLDFKGRISNASIFLLLTVSSPLFLYDYRCSIYHCLSCILPISQMYDEIVH